MGLNSPFGRGPFFSAYQHGLLACVLLVGVARCGPPDEFSGVYEERLPLAEVRPYAVRLTLFEYSDEAGGMVEYFPVNERNTPEDPYYEAESCAYFGPGAVRGSSFQLDATGPDGTDFTLRTRSSQSGDRLTGTVVYDGGVTAELPDADATIAFERVDATPRRRCPVPVVPSLEGSAN